MKRGDLRAADSTIFEVPVDAIDIPNDRLRSLKAHEAEAIGKAMVADGQYEPITIAQLPGRDGFTLIDGLHRLTGARLVGMATIQAVFGPAEADARRRREVLSAWARAGHDAFDKALQVAEMAGLEGRGRGRRHARFGQGDADDFCNTMLQALRWDEATAAALGISRMQVFRHLKLATFYDQKRIARLRELSQADDTMPLVRLADLPPEDFDRAWALIEAGEGIAAAMAAVAPGPVDTFSKARTSILKKLADWPAMERKRLLADLLDTYDRNGEPKVAKDAAND